MRALQANEANGALTVVDDRAKPTIENDDDVIVKVDVAALNPVDAQMHRVGFFVKAWPHVFGCDMAGTVSEVGESAAEKFAVGDRVWAYTSLGEPHSGTLAEFVKVPSAMLGRVPEDVSMEGASTIGVGFLTAALMMHAMELEDGSAATPVLVYGASSSVGQYLVQLSKHFGHKVVAVASERNKDLVMQLGADDFVDYKTEGWEMAAAEALGGSGSGAKGLISVSSPEIVKAVGRVLQATGGDALCTTNPSDPTKVPGLKVVGANLGTAYNVPEARAVVERYMTVAEELLEQGKLQTIKVKVLEGGLEAGAEGFKMLLDGKVSGAKLVVKV